uniref:gustatory receptor 78 n=1 Tax=Aedes aegypti TaxID=7159 RepID=UPI000C2835CB|nr:gustatory receptor 78 [Aedes aegypti]
MGSIFGRLAEQWRRHDTFFDVIWSGQWFTDRLGLSVMTYKENSRIPTVKKVPWGLIVTIVGQLVILYFNIQTNVIMNNSSSFIIRYGMRWVFSIGTFMLLLVTALNAVFRKRTFNLMKGFYDFDLKLKAIGYEIDFKEQNDWCNMVIIISGSLITLITIATCYLVIKTSPGIYVFSMSFMTICWTNYVVMISTGQYVFYNYSFQFRFKTLNKYLCELLPTDVERNNQFRQRDIHKNRYILMDRIGEIAQLHSELVTQVGHYSENYAVQLLQSYFGLIVMTIFSAFTLYRALVRPDPDSDYIAIINFCWSSYYTAYLLFNITLAGMIQTQAKKIGISIHKAIDLLHDEEICDKLLLFSNQVYHRTPVVNCKLFNFDGSLIFSTLGAITTYLVILIQFDILSGDIQ